MERKSRILRLHPWAVRRCDFRSRLRRRRGKKKKVPVLFLSLMGEKKKAPRSPIHPPARSRKGVKLPLSTPAHEGERKARFVRTFRRRKKTRTNDGPPIQGRAGPVLGRLEAVSTKGQGQERDRHQRAASHPYLEGRGRKEVFGPANRPGAGAS